ncbi:BPTI/Kunitz domain-containing protein 3-like [Ostrea edulis]|uniref:BPTI/Kunitz domain-containing protein 3-like n=1 Tax=Ostrea edulis TaxID=37623 RepID=UPI0024AF9A44|nr:BPTI/Kunitz domain-containing protein 3-like [Ostrea edulis]
MNSLVFLLGLCGTAAAQTDVFGWMLNLNFQPAECKLPMRPGYPRLNGPYGQTNWFFNATSKQCESFEYYGKGGNRNRFRTPIHCLKRCGCQLQEDPGFCPNSTTSVIRYAYNRLWRFCTEFEYYGCGGNMNNFASFFECQFGCGGFEF